MQDLRLAVRLLFSQPGFAAVAISTLALTIGANTTAFSIVENILVRDLPYSHAGQLVSITANRPDGSVKGLNVSFTKLQRIEAQAHTLTGAGAYFAVASSIATSRGPEEVAAALATPSLFETLGVLPAIGRGFAAADDLPGGPDVVIATDGFWKSHFGGDPAVVGRPIRLDGRVFTLIGVLPASFRFPLTVPEPQLWFPRVFENPVFTADRVKSGASFLGVIGRRRAGAATGDVARELTSLNAAYAHDYPGNADASLILETDSLHNSLVGQARVPLFVLFGASSLVLLIGCINIAGLFAARATSREREIALRVALGATRPRLVRQLMTESLLIAAAGGALGVFLAFTAIGLLPGLPPGLLPRADAIHLDAGALAFSFIVSVAAGLFFGLTPSWYAGSRRMQESMSQGGRGHSAGRRSGRTRSLLVTGQVALAFVLVVSAGLLVRSFANLMRVDSGFDPAPVMTFHLALPLAKYPQPAQQAEFYRRLAERVQTNPAVEKAGAASALPLEFVRFVYVCPQGAVCKGVGQDPLVVMRQVTPRYLETIGIPLLRGRAFDDHDAAGSRPVAIINETAAAQLFAGQDPVGRHLTQSRGHVETDIVGLVRDVRSRGPNNPPMPEMFVPQLQSPSRSMTLVVRSSAEPAPLIAAARSAVAELDPDVAVADAAPMSTLVNGAVSQPRVTMALVGGFGALALLLAAIGLQGVLAFTVTQRTQEIGTRVALGATPAQVLWLVLRQSVRLVLAGGLIGFVISLETTPLLSSLLFGTTARDPWTFIVVTLTIAATGLGASYFPARRASRVDPVIALRQQ